MRLPMSAWPLAADETFAGYYTYQTLVEWSIERISMEIGVHLRAEDAETSVKDCLDGITPWTSFIVG